MTHKYYACCSMLAEPDSGTMSYRVRRMMPTVGCEADAVAFTEQSENLWLSDDIKYEQNMRHM